ncbi:hypothetical protein GCM10007874_63530 [Labrys miyagiensis]|uniref:Lipoprotein n=1 Tax=Labrys miyagiensis TaxID=346912 RepID=A0ABQ6CU54_9HYPH|nr:hypothetical protein [Labrys miyagiensis]GLS23333.1 hypothetical protein GCM10007874_63530 [Labrys miyagiensis]
MKVGYLCLAGLVSAGLAGCTGQNGQPEVGLRSDSGYTIHAKSRQSVQIYDAYQVTVDCSTLGATPSISITGKPQHGTATVAIKSAHPAYPATNPRYKCNQKTIPMAVVNYQSNLGFVGTDTVKLHTDFHESPDNPSEDIVAVIKVGP